MRGILHRLRQNRSGAAAVEFAFVSLLFVVVTTAVIEFARGLYVLSDLSYAADVGERKILLDSTVSDTALETSVRSAFSAGSSSSLEVTIDTTIISSKTYRALSLVYPFSPIIPDFITDTINISVNRRIPESST